MKRTVTFEVDSDQLFYGLKNMDGDTVPLGRRLVETLLAEPGASTVIGMAFYGVSVLPPTGAN